MLYRVIIFGLVMTIFSCKSMTHPWFKSPDHFVGGNKIEIQYIKDEYKLNYISKLEDIEYIVLNKNEAEKISVDLINTITDESYFIVVRALYSIRGGQYSAVLSNNNELLISYRVLAKSNYKNNKDALILQLKELPKIVYVTSRIIK